MCKTRYSRSANEGPKDSLPLRHFIPNQQSNRYSHPDPSPGPSTVPNVNLSSRVVCKRPRKSTPHRHPYLDKHDKCQHGEGRGGGRPHAADHRNGIEEGCEHRSDGKQHCERCFAVELAHDRADPSCLHPGQAGITRVFIPIKVTRHFPLGLRHGTRRDPRSTVRQAARPGREGGRDRGREESRRSQGSTRMLCAYTDLIG